MQRTLWLSVLGVVSLLAAVGAGWVVQRSALGHGLELRAYDLRFYFRGAQGPRVDPEIVLVTLDDESFDRIGKPLILWQGEFGRLLSGLALAGARVAALDFLLPDVSQVDPEGQQRFVEALLTAPAHGMAVVLAYRVRGTAVDQPPGPFLMAVGEDGFGFVNLTTDPDDFVRRQELVAIGENGGLSPSWALRVAEHLVSRPVSYPESPLLINFMGRNRFRQVPFWRVLEAVDQGEHKFLELEFSGKAVLVGIDGDDDRHPTPLYFQPEGSDGSSPRRTLGLEIHAHTIRTLRSGNYIQRAPSGLQWLAIAGLAGLVIGTALRLPLVASLALSGALLVFYLWMALVWSFRGGTWIDVVAPVGAAVVGLTCAQSGRYLLEGREKQKLRRLFQRYVSPEVVSQLLERPEKLVLTGEARDVTILFSDIRGFTTLSEHLRPEEVVSRLNRYFAVMIEAIHRHGGMVDKFIGDAVMAVFGAPLADRLHPDHAVQAALDMLSALEKLNRQWAEEGIAPFQIGIGLHSGEAVVGNVGSPERLDYTAIGDVVNTASRLESMTKELGCSLLVSEETRRRLRPELASKLAGLGQVRLKGKERLVEVFGPVAQRDAMV
jgi:adenylate cyclase